MKKSTIMLAVALIATLTSCSVPSSLTNTATHKSINVAKPVTAVFADLEVSPKKISFFYLPSNNVIAGGTENVINTAVREALLANGDADVLVGIEKQIKYDDKGLVESITITGYPAKYVNFRSPGDDYLRKISEKEPFDTPKGNTSIIGKLKIGK